MSTQEKISGEGSLREQGYFRSSEIGVDELAIGIVNKKAFDNENFRARCDFSADWEKLKASCNGKHTIYTYKKDKKVMALFIITRDDQGSYCDNVCISDSMDEDLKEKLVRYIRFMTAKTSLDNGKKTAKYMGEELPALLHKTHINVAYLIFFTLIYGSLFGVATQIWSLALCGFPLALCFSLKTFFKFEE